MGFPIHKTLTLAFEATFDGKTDTVEHVMKVPSAQDKIDYWRGLAEKEDDGGKTRIADLLEVAVATWIKLVVSVDGYDIPEGEDYKEHVPVEHQQDAIGALFNAYGRLSPVTEKD